MYIVTIRKKEGRRSGGDRRKSKGAAATSVRRTVDLSRRKVSDRRSGEDRRKATTYELADDQKPTLDRIVGMLERSILRIKPRGPQPPLRRTSGMKAKEDVALAINILYSKKCGGGFNQLEVFADPGRAIYIVKNRLTGMEADIPSHWVDRDKGSGEDREVREQEIVRSFRKLGKPCKE